MKKLFLFMSILLISFGYTFAITQTVNETNGVNYGYLKGVYKKGSTYFLSVDYIQYYQSYEAALARAEDGFIIGSLSTDFNQNYPTSYYTTNSNGAILATKVIRKKLTAYLVKIGKKGREQFIAGFNNYDGTNQSEMFNSLTETKRMIAGPSFDPATGWGGNYIRNTSSKIRNIPFSSSAKITVEGTSMSLKDLLNRSKEPTQNLVKVFLRKGKIEGFRIEYHP